MVTQAESRVPDGALLAPVAERYGLRSPLTVRRLAGGYANDVFRVGAAGASVVVHVKHPPVNGASIAWEHRVVTALAHWLPPALPPLPALDAAAAGPRRRRCRPSTVRPGSGSRAARCGWSPYATGAPAAVHDRDVVAAALGRLHAAPLEVAPRPGHARLLELPLPPVSGLPEEFTQQLPRLIRARDELTDLLSWIPQERRP